MIALLSGLVELCRRHAWAVLILAVLASVASGYYASQSLGVDTDTGKLFSSDLAWRKEQVAFDAAFPNGTGASTITTTTRRGVTATPPRSPSKSRGSCRPRDRKSVV